MKKLLTAIFVISITVPAFAKPVKGIVYDETGEPMIGATVRATSNKQLGTITDTDGKFTFLDVPDNETSLTVIYVGYEQKTVDIPTDNSDVTVNMETDPEKLDEVKVVICKPNAPHATTTLYDTFSKKCRPSECESARYILTNTKKVKKINDISCTTDPDDQCDDGEPDCTTITIGDACVDQVGTDCTAPNAETAKYEWADRKLNCVIEKCVPGYEVSGNACVKISGKCKSLPRKAKSGTRGWNAETSTEICYVTECESGYSISDDRLSCQPKLSEADSRARVNELRENAKKMHDKETSTANKLIGAAGIGATGIGASQALSALSEQRADKNAENDMRAYLATIKCDYGTGKTVIGGETGIELPGGNELTQYVTQYKTLAADLKVRKTALGMTPGIESETIIDAAETGLYDNAATGKTTGAFTSLSRALDDETSADAQAWAQQKADTARKLKTGAIVAGVGAVGSAIANLAVNSGADKQNKSDEILAKYASKYTQKLQAVIDNVEQQTKTTQCADFTGATGTFPNCQCSNPTQYFTVDGGCITCDGGHVVNQDKTGCECPTNLPVEKDGNCIAKTPDCNLSGLKNTDKCECITNATAVNNECVCNDGYTKSDGNCIKDQPAPTTSSDKITLNINSDTFFAPGKAIVNNANQLETDLKGKMNELSGQDWDNLTYCVSVTGHTDRTKFKRDSKMNNLTLSKQRAQAVEEIMQRVFTKGTPDFQSIGKGAAECTTQKHPRPNDSNCRRVKITITAGECTAANTHTITRVVTAVINETNVPDTATTNNETNEPSNPTVTTSSQPLSDEDVRQAMSDFADACENYRDNTGTIGKFFVNDRTTKYHNSTHLAQDAYCIFLKSAQSGAPSGVDEISKQTITDLNLNIDKLKESIGNDTILSGDSSTGSTRCQQTFANINAPENTAYQGQNIAIQDQYTACKFVLQDISKN